jgi:iron complex outermembrane receptor protein
MNMSRNVVSPYLRGVGTQNTGAGEEGSIATYIDGVYISALSSSTLAFNNVERVEVLKGPQGTLFGRNATGGLIQIITKDPSHNTSVRGTIGYANYQTVSGSVYATTGLTEKMAIDFGATGSYQGHGWGRNVSGLPGVNGDRVNRDREWAVRSKLLFTPTDQLKITLAGDYAFRDSDIGISRQVLPGTQFTCRGQICNIPAVQALITPPGQAPILSIPYSVMALGRRSVGGKFDSARGEAQLNDFKTYGGSLKADYDLGDATLTSTTAYRRVLNKQLFDQDGGPAVLGDTEQTEKTRTFQQELLLVGRTGRLDYTGGLFYFNARGGTFPLAVRSIVPSNNFDRTSVINTKSYAIFAQGTYHVTDTTGITAGVRYTIDKRGIRGQDQAVPVGTNPMANPGTGALINPVAPQNSTFRKVTYRFAVDQKLTDTVLLYASYSRGYKSGVYNITNFRDPVARPETLDSFEGGIKADLLDRTLRINASAFHYKYKDIQLLNVVGAGVTQIFNAASAKVNGADLEVVVAPPVQTGSLHVTANMSYLHGRYGQFQNMLILVPKLNFATGLPTGASTSISANTSGQIMIRTPPITTNIGVDYSFPVGAGDLGFNVNYYFNSGFFWDADNRVKQPSYDLINAQISYELPDSGWKITGFVRNLANKFYYAQVSTSGGIGDQYSAGAPRTYGITLGFKY